jgi:hypothetical protein
MTNTQFKTQGKLVVIRTTGEVEQVPAILHPRKSDERKMSWPERRRAEASFEQFRSLVGSLELFYQHHLRGVTAFVNGNGQNIGLPVNGLATVLFEHALVGDVVICKDGMYSDGLSGEALDRVMAAIDAVPDQTLRLYTASGKPVFVKVQRKQGGSGGGEENERSGNVVVEVA